MKRIAKNLLAAMAGILLLTEGFCISELAGLWGSYPSLNALLQKEYSLVFTVLVWPLIALRFVWKIVAERGIVATGLVTIGRVKEWWSGKRGFFLVYAFHDAAGLIHSSKSVDLTGAMEENMPVLVFFHELNPEESTAMCGAFFEVCRPGNNGRG